MKTRFRSIPGAHPIILAGIALLPMLAIAQWQVNTQVPRQMNVGGAPSVRYASNPMTQRGYSSVALPSETRMAYRASGALPSEVKMNYNAIGPMAPSGAIAYIPPARNYRTPPPVTQGNYINSNAAPSARPMASPTMAPLSPAVPTYSPSITPRTMSPSAAMAPVNGSVRYAPAGFAPSALTPKSSLQSARLNQAPIDASVKYSR